MHVGLTYDLRDEYLAAGYTLEQTAELDHEDTIAALELALRALGHQTERIGHGKQLCRRLVQGAQWDLVFNICEGINGIARESQVPCLLDLYGIPYVFSDPLSLSLSLHKGLAKRVVRDAGLATSPFMVVSHPAEAENPIFPPPYFVKPIAEGTGKGVTERSIVRDGTELQSVCSSLIMTFQQPVLVERYLTGREFTVGVLGSGSDAQALGTLEICLLETAEAGVYSYLNKAEFEDRVRYRLPPRRDAALIEAVEQIALASWRVLGCRDGGRVDIRCDEKGQPQFLEVNPLAGLHPVHSDLPILCGHIGLAYQELIRRIVDSACKRLPFVPVELPDVASVPAGFDVASVMA